jgi:F-type H+-transporting ATPase subunit delta
MAAGRDKRQIIMADKQQIKTRIESVMHDPGAGAVAGVYAAALLNSIPAGEQEERIGEFRSFMSEIIEKQPEFAQVLSSGMVSRDEKVALIDRVLVGRASELFVNFLRVLARHDRLDLLALILAQAEIELERRLGKKRIQVVSAQPLSDSALAGIRDQLARDLQITPILETAVDPSLLGGVRIRVGDTVYDGSLRSRLTQLRSRVRERSLHEIQSGRNRFSSPEGN